MINLKVFCPFERIATAIAFSFDIDDFTIDFGSFGARRVVMNETRNVALGFSEQARLVALLEKQITCKVTFTESGEVYTVPVQVHHDLCTRGRVPLKTRKPMADITNGKIAGQTVGYPEAVLYRLDSDNFDYTPIDEPLWSFDARPFFTYVADLNSDRSMAHVHGPCLNPPLISRLSHWASYKLDDQETWDVYTSESVLDVGQYLAYVTLDDLAAGGDALSEPHDEIMPFGEIPTVRLDIDGCEIRKALCATMIPANGVAIAPRDVASLISACVRDEVKKEPLAYHFTEVSDSFVPCDSTPVELAKARGCYDLGDRLVFTEKDARIEGMLLLTDERTLPTFECQLQHAVATRVAASEPSVFFRTYFDIVGSASIAKVLHEGAPARIEVSQRPFTAESVSTPVVNEVYVVACDDNYGSNASEKQDAVYIAKCVSPTTLEVVWSASDMNKYVSGDSLPRDICTLIIEVKYAR